MTKWVYSFGDGKAEGARRDANLLGGKGANLAEMSNLGLPVPPGFTITTEVCTYFYANGQTYPDRARRRRSTTALAQVEQLVGAQVRRRRRSRCWSRCAPARAPRCRA